jgi:voltage-gated potassium channel
MDSRKRPLRTVSEAPPDAGWRARAHEIIYEADTPLGRTFDIALLSSIIISIIAMMLESIAGVRLRFGGILRGVEWLFAVLFSIEYVLRILSVRHPLRYVWSFFGIVDLLAVLPTYAGLFLAGSQYFLVIRAFRLLRVFRMLKLARIVGEARILILALKASRPKITVFMVPVLVAVLIAGSVMYVVEGEASGFTSIPRSIYWAVVTMTTVGYGDVAPVTPLGQTLAAFLMILGVGVIAVPTGIVTAELAIAGRAVSTQACPSCGEDGHDHDAEFCKYCGSAL